MEHLLKMRTRFQLRQVVRYKNKHDVICIGLIIGLHDDYIRVKDVKDLKHFYVYRVNFEDVIGQCSQ